MQHARDRAARAGADVGGGARDGAGDADAAEQGRADIGDALRHQFAIRAVPAAGHAVGDHRREQRLRSRRAARRRSRPGSTAAHLRERERRQRRHRQAARNAAEARADGLDRQRQRARPRARPAATAISMPGQCGRKRRRPRMTAMRDSATRRRHRLTVGIAPPSACSFGIRSPGSLPASVSPKRSLQLAREDDDGDAGGEADRHGIGNELDVGAEPQQTRPRSGTPRPSRWPGSGRRCRGARPSPPPAR